MHNVFYRFSRCNLRQATIVYRLIGEALIGNFFNGPFLILNQNFDTVYHIRYAVHLRVKLVYTPSVTHSLNQSTRFMLAGLDIGSKMTLKLMFSQEYNRFSLRIAFNSYYF